MSENRLKINCGLRKPIQTPRLNGMHRIDDGKSFVVSVQWNAKIIYFDGILSNVKQSDKPKSFNCVHIHTCVRNKRFLQKNVWTFYYRTEIMQYLLKNTAERHNHTYRQGKRKNERANNGRVWRIWSLYSSVQFRLTLNFFQFLFSVPIHCRLHWRFFTSSLVFFCSILYT